MTRKEKRAAADAKRSQYSTLLLNELDRVIAEKKLTVDEIGVHMSQLTDKLIYKNPQENTLILEALTGSKESIIAKLVPVSEDEILKERRAMMTLGSIHAALIKGGF